MNKSESIKNITPAIIAVMQAVKGMEKNSRVGKGQNAYNGVNDTDVKDAFNTALSSNGLAILPIGIEEDTDINRWEEDTQYGLKQKSSVFTKVKTTYLLTHTSGEFIEIVGYGHGVDAMDKGAGKATTYALKNCLLYTFLTPVGKIDDTDSTHSNDIKTPVKQAVKKQPIAQELKGITAEVWKLWEGNKIEKLHGHDVLMVKGIYYKLNESWIDGIKKDKRYPK